MKIMSHRILTIGVCVVFFAGAPLRAEDPEMIPIGIVDSLLTNLSPARLKLLDSEFPSLVQEFTGLKSQIAKGGDPFAAGKKLAANEWRLGVFQGIEFAWAQSKDPKLQPLLLAVNHKGPVHAFLVVKGDSKWMGFADLEGKEVQLLQGQQHCRLFAEKGAKGDPKTFFGKLMPASGRQAALDEILLDKVQAAIVDSAALETYKDIHPGRFKRLKVLARSEPFPPKVIAYYQGGLSDGVLAKFRDGMIKANETPRGREAMADIGITGFEPVMDDSRKLIVDILKAYPAPTK